jgi:DNA-binding transcriptional LysR family regulator
MNQELRGESRGGRHIGTDEVQLRHLRSFLELAAELHFGRAADILGIAQPALSGHIRKLEADLGTRLFRRTSRSVELTPAGTVLRERATRILQQTTRDLSEVRSVGRGESGVLHLGFASSTLPLGFADQIQKYRHSYPDVRVRLHEGYTSQLMGILAEGEIDAALVRDPDPAQGVTTEPIATEPFSVILPQQHPLAQAETLTGMQISDEPFIFYPESAGKLAHRLNLSPITEAGKNAEIIQEASHWTTIMHLVGVGLGITIAPLSATYTAPSTVRAIPLTNTSAQSTVHIAWREHEERPIVKNFLYLATPYPQEQDSTANRTLRSGRRPLRNA